MVPTSMPRVAQLGNFLLSEIVSGGMYPVTLFPELLGYRSQNLCEFAAVLLASTFSRELDISSGTTGIDENMEKNRDRRRSLLRAPDRRWFFVARSQKGIVKVQTGKAHVKAWLRW